MITERDRLNHAGPLKIAVGIGGSATTDGGAGLLRTLGATVSDDLGTVGLADLDPRLASWIFYGGLEEILTGWVLGQLPDGDEEVARAERTIIDVVCGGLTASGGAGSPEAEAAASSDGPGRDDPGAGWPEHAVGPGEAREDLLQRGHRSVSCPVLCGAQLRPQGKVTHKGVERQVTIIVIIGVEVPPLL